MQPLFVAGIPRSGTTQVAAFVGAHPKTLTPPAARHVLDALANLWSGGDIDWVAFREHRHQRDLGVPGTAWLDEARVPGSLQEFTEKIQMLRRQQAVAAGRPDAVFWIEHSPRAAQYAHMLADIYPQTQFLLVMRDPRAVAASLLRLPWGPSTPAGAAEWWLQHYGRITAATSGLGDRVRWYRFEQLCLEPDAMRIDAWQWFGLDVHDDDVDVNVHLRIPERGHAQSALVGGAFDATRTDGWRHELSPWAVAEIEAVLGHTLTGLGYEPVGGRRRRGRAVRDLLSKATRNRLWRLKALNGRTTMERT